MGIRGREYCLGKGIGDKGEGSGGGKGGKGGGKWGMPTPMSIPSVRFKSTLFIICNLHVLNHSVWQLLPQ